MLRIAYLIVAITALPSTAATQDFADDLCVHLAPANNVEDLEQYLGHCEVGRIILWEVGDGWISTAIPIARVCDFSQQIVVEELTRGDATTTAVACVFSGFR